MQLSCKFRLAVCAKTGIIPGVEEFVFWGQDEQDDKLGKSYNPVNEEEIL